MIAPHVRRIGLLLVLATAAACDDCNDFKHLDCDLDYFPWDVSPNLIVENRVSILDPDVVGVNLRRGQSANMLQAFRINYQQALAGNQPQRDTLETDDIFALNRPYRNPFSLEYSFGGLFRNRLTNWRFANNQFWTREILNPTTEYWSTSFSSNGSTTVATGYETSGNINFYCQSDVSSWSHCGSFSGTPQGDVIWDSFFGANRHSVLLGPAGRTFLLWDRVFSDGTVPTIGQFDADKELVCWRDLDILDSPVNGDLLFETGLQWGRLGQSLGFGYWNRNLLARHPVVGTLWLNPCVAEGNCGPNMCVLDGTVEKTNGPYFDTTKEPFVPSLGLRSFLLNDTLQDLGIPTEDPDREIHTAIYPRQISMDFGSSFWKTGKGWSGVPLQSEVKYGTPVFDYDCKGSNCIGTFGDSDNTLTAVKSQVSRRQSELNFPQLLAGGNIGTEASINNLDLEMPANVSVTIRDQAGNLRPFSVNNGVIDFTGNDYNGVFTTTIPPCGKLTLQADPSGPLSISTMQVTSDKRVSGVVTFNGPFLASVQSARRLTGFSAPVKTNTSISLNTGVALQDLSGSPLGVDYFLCDNLGNVLATAPGTVDPNGQAQQFITELDWTPVSGATFDINNFDGTLKGFGTGPFAASALEGRGTQFTTVSTSPITDRPF